MTAEIRRGIVRNAATMASSSTNMIDGERSLVVKKEFNFSSLKLA
jgi:hypothetical protein